MISKGKKVVRKAIKEDAIQITEIYNYYILNSIATFEEKVLNGEEMERRIEKISLTKPFLVYEESREILGYAYASEWNKRSAYKFSAESTVYLKDGQQRKGVGSMLYRQLLQELQAMKYRAIIGGISLPNKASIAFHEKFDFKKVAHFQKVGYKFDKWIDVGYWELIFN